jgi:hypothetical protein
MQGLSASLLSQSTYTTTVSDPSGVKPHLVAVLVLLAVVLSSIKKQLLIFSKNWSLIESKVEEVQFVEKF